MTAAQRATPEPFQESSIAPSPASSQNADMDRGQGRDFFASAAVRLAGLMARLAGWTPDIFWCATPAEAMMSLRGWLDGRDDRLNGTHALDALDVVPDPYGTPSYGSPKVNRTWLAHMMEQFPDG